MADKKSCTFGGFTHADGSQICRDGKCVKCVEGKWEETGESCPCR
jgi:hypothetical protein